jgi:hypothetical protein
MSNRSQHSKVLMVLAGLAGAPVLLAFLLGSLPFLIPVLIHRWLTRPATGFVFLPPNAAAGVAS